MRTVFLQGDAINGARLPWLAVVALLVAVSLAVAAVPEAVPQVPRGRPPM